MLPVRNFPLRHFPVGRYFYFGAIYNVVILIYLYITVVMIAKHKIIVGMNYLE